GLAFGSIDPEVPLRLVVVAGILDLLAHSLASPLALAVGASFELLFLTLVLFEGFARETQAIGSFALMARPSAVVLARGATPFVEFEHGRHGMFEKCSVVRHDHRRAVARPDPAFETTQTVEIQVVGWFVQ